MQAGQAVISLLYIDCNGYLPAISSIEKVYPYIAPGGIICIDEKIQGHRYTCVLCMRVVTCLHLLMPLHRILIAVQPPCVRGIAGYLLEDILVPYVRHLPFSLTQLLLRL